MKIFVASDYSIHLPAKTLRLGEWVPSRDTVERPHRIKDSLISTGHELVTVDSPVLEEVELVHSREYLDFLRTSWTDWTKVGGAGAEVMPTSFPAKNAVCTYPDTVVGRAGFHMSDLWVPIGERTYEAACLSAGLAVAAAKSVLATGQTAYALCRPSGHHASADTAGGNCFLNNAAIAAQCLRRQASRVAIIDIDVHHGNGTQQIFYDRDDVLFTSVHRHPGDFYPFFTGYAHETGAGEGAGYNANFPLPGHSNDKAFFDAVAAASRLIERFEPDALVVSLGVDAHAFDPTDGMKVTDDGYKYAAAELAKLRLPTVFVQEGGYNEEIIGHCVNLALSSFENS